MSMGHTTAAEAAKVADAREERLKRISGPQTVSREDRRAMFGAKLGKAPPGAGRRKAPRPPGSSTSDELKLQPGDATDPGGYGLEPEPAEEPVSMVCAMGFSEQEASTAVAATSGATTQAHVAAAIELLLSQPSAPLDQEPELLVPGLAAQPSLATSTFKQLYNPAKAPGYQDEIMAAVRQLLDAYAAQHGLPQERARNFFERLQREAFTSGGGAQQMLGDVASGSQRLWTSGLKLDGVPPQFEKELCSILNTALREDNPAQHSHTLSS